MWWEALGSAVVEQNSRETSKEATATVQAGGDGSLGHLQTEPRALILGVLCGPLVGIVDREFQQVSKDHAPQEWWPTPTRGAALWPEKPRESWGRS